MSSEEVNKGTSNPSSEDEDDDKDFLSADDDDEVCIQPAYSVADMLGALSDDEDEDNKGN